MGTDPRFVVLNLQDQPLELYAGERVVVVPPRGRIELSEAEQASPQVQALRRTRQLAIRPAPRAEGEEGEDQPEQEEENAEATDADADPEAAATPRKRTPTKRKKPA